MNRNKKKVVTLSKSCQQFLTKCINKAEKIQPSKKKISKTIRKARDKFERLRNLPKCDALFENICNFCDLLSDYLDGTYHALPLATIVACLGGLIYLVCPFDVFADFLPFIGWVDDAAVLAFVMNAEQKDVTEYLARKENQVLIDAK